MRNLRLWSAVSSVMLLFLAHGKSWTPNTLSLIWLISIGIQISLDWRERCWCFRSWKSINQFSNRACLHSFLFKIFECSGALSPLEIIDLFTGDRTKFRIWPQSCKIIGSFSSIGKTSSVASVYAILKKIPRSYLLHNVIVSASTIWVVMYRFAL